MRSPLAEALAALGRGLTGDADVTVQPRDLPVTALVAVLEKQGFRPRVADVENFVACTRVLPFAHADSAMPVDVVFAGPGLEEHAAANANGRGRARLCREPRRSRRDEDARRTGQGRGRRGRDLAAQRRLDVRLVQATLRRPERAIDGADLVPRFETLLARSRRTPGR